MSCVGLETDHFCYIMPLVELNVFYNPRPPPYSVLRLFARGVCSGLFFVSYCNVLFSSHLSPRAHLHVVEMLQFMSLT